MPLSVERVSGSPPSRPMIWTLFTSCMMASSIVATGLEHAPDVSRLPQSPSNVVRLSAVADRQQGHRVLARVQSGHRKSRACCAAAYWTGGRFRGTVNVLSHLPPAKSSSSGRTMLPQAVPM